MYVNAKGIATKLVETSIKDFYRVQNGLRKQEIKQFIHLNDINNILTPTCRRTNVILVLIKVFIGRSFKICIK